MLELDAQIAEAQKEMPGTVVRVGLVWSQDAAVDTSSLATFYHNSAQAIGFQVVVGPFIGITYYKR